MQFLDLKKFTFMEGIQIFIVSEEIQIVDFEEVQFFVTEEIQNVVFEEVQVFVFEEIHILVSSQGAMCTSTKA